MEKAAALLNRLVSQLQTTMRSKDIREPIMESLADAQSELDNAITRYVAMRDEMVEAANP